MLRLSDSVYGQTSVAAVGVAANELGGAGGPLSVLIVTIVAAEMGKIVSKETKIDILVSPMVTIGVGAGLSILCAPTIGQIASSIGGAIMWATELQPFFMGILVSVLVGMALTLPISSAAICAALSLTGLAGGAAVAGCCAQMVGFAVMSFKENKWGGLLAQGIGTSMLQMGNRKESKNLDSTNTCSSNYRPNCNLHFPYGNEWCCSSFRNGDLWICRTDRGIYGMAF